jgi:hypothetical protein
MAPAKVRVAAGSGTGAAAAAQQAAETQPAGDSYLARLVKYIPSEIIGVYVIVLGFIGSNVAGGKTSSGQLALDQTQQFLVFGAFLVATPIYTWIATSKKGLPAATGQVLISFVSFAAWAFALGGPFTTLDFYAKQGPMIAAIALPVVVLVAGFFVPKPQQV